MGPWAQEILGLLHCDSLSFHNLCQPSTPSCGSPSQFQLGWREWSLTHTLFCPIEAIGSKKRALVKMLVMFGDVSYVAGASGTISHFLIGGMPGGEVAKCLFLLHSAVSTAAKLLYHLGMEGLFSGFSWR